MRELIRLLDLNAGAPLRFDTIDKTFYFSHSISDVDGVRVEDEVTKEFLVSSEWEEIVQFITESKNQSQFLYELVLAGVGVSFLCRKVPTKAADDDRTRCLQRLMNEEPLLKRVLGVIIRKY